MAGAFDDLIPAQTKGKGAFDDLVPTNSVQPEQEDKYRQAARKELKDKGLLDRGNLANLTDMGRKGYTFGFNDELAAAALTPIEMFRQGTLNPAEAYRFAKAREDILQEEAKRQTGGAGLAAEVLGGAAMGGRLANAGFSLMRPGQAFLPRLGAGIGEGALYGGTTGIGEAKSIADIPMEAGKGALFGGAAGGAVTAASPIVAALGRNAMGWVSAVRDPAGYAERQTARAIAESGMNPQQIAQEVATANAAGQPFTLADALGNSGQRMLSTVARAPGAGRQATVDFLEGRQGDQGRRLAAILAEGLDAPQTAAQAREAMLQARGAAANTNYGAARQQAGAVDVSPAIQRADDVLQPGVTRMFRPADNIADNSIEATVRRARAYLTDGRSQVSDFQQALLAKQELDALIESARPTVQRALIPIRNELDNALAASSVPYANARNQFRQQSQAIEAIDTGSTAAQRGRTEDTTRLFAGMTPEQQQGFRVGYGDRLIEAVQGGAMGQNKARPFTSQAMQTELPTFAAQGRGQPMMDRIARENRMFETRGQALGGSRTADNLNDQAAMGVSPEIIGNVLSGNYLTAARNLVGRSSGALSGYTPRVREELSRILLSGNGTAGQLDAYLQHVVQNEEVRRRIMASYLSGALAGSSQGTASQRR